MKKIILICASVMIAAGCSSDETAGALSSLKLNESSVSLSVGDTYQLIVTTNLDDANIRVTWGSSDKNVATVDNSGLVTGTGPGTAVITASSGNYKDTCSVTIETPGPYDATAALASGANAGIIFSRDVLQFSSSRIMQGFDITPSGNIYYSQLNSATTVNVCRATGPNQNTIEYMHLNNFGHGTQIVAEEASDGKTYIWVNSNGTIDANGESVNNRSFSRVEFKARATYNNYAGDTFILNKNSNNQVDQQVAIDFATRRLLVVGRQSGIRYHWIFDLDEAMALTPKTMSVSLNDGSGTISRSLTARDLNECTVLASFTLSQGTNKETDVWSYSHQGHELHGDYVYFYEGAVETLATDSFRSKGYVTVLDLKGKIAVPRTEVAAISDLVGLKTTGLTTTGYAEPESIKVKNGKLYVGAACRNASGSTRRATIFVYDCVQK